MADRLTGAIIAAGQGNRLRPEVAGRPKPLVEVGGKSLLLHQIDGMRRLGIETVQIVINSETARLLKRQSTALPSEAEIHVADTANSMESLLTLGTRIPPGRFLLSTVDVVVEEEELVNFFTRAQKNLDQHYDGALGVVGWSGETRPLFVEVTGEGRITRFGEEPSDRITAGLYLFTTRIFEHADEARALGLDALRRFLDFLERKKLRFAAVDLGLAIDVDEAADLERAATMINRRRGRGESG